MPPLAAVPLTKPWFLGRGQHPRQPLQRRRLRRLSRPRGRGAARSRGGSRPARPVRSARGRPARGHRRAARARPAQPRGARAGAGRRRTRPPGTASAGSTPTARRGRRSTSSRSPGIPNSCRSDFDAASATTSLHAAAIARRRRHTNSRCSGGNMAFEREAAEAVRRRRGTGPATGVEIDTPTTPRTQDRAAGLRSAGVGVDHGAAAHGDLRGEDAAADAADRPPADRPAVPGSRRRAGDVLRVRRADGLRRRPAGGAGGGLRGDRDGDADALAAARARHGARGAGPDRRVRRGDRQPRPLQGGPRRAAVGRHGQGRRPRRRRRLPRSSRCCRRSGRGGTASTPTPSA